MDSSSSSQPCRPSQVASSASARPSRGSVYGGSKVGSGSTIVRAAPAPALPAALNPSMSFGNGSRSMGGSMGGGSGKGVPASAGGRRMGGGWKA